VFVKLQKKLVLASPYSSVRPSAWDTSASTGQIFKKLWVFFFEKSVDKIQI